MTQAKSTIKMYEYFTNKYKHLDFSKPEKILLKLVKLKNKKGEDMSVSCIKVILSSIVWSLKQDPKTSKETLAKYTSYIKDLKNIAGDEERDHTKVLGIIPQWDDVIKIRGELLENKELKNHLIISLYTYIPPRRLKDYVLLKIAKNENNMKDKEYNYYDISKKTLIFNNYKTQKQYNQQLINVPDELATIIDNYIDTRGLKSGELLLEYKDYHQLLYALKKLVGCGVDNIRHSFVNKEMEKMPDLEKNAEMMGHSVQTHMNYKKV